MTTSNQTEGFINRANSILPFLPEEATSTKLTKDNSVTLELRSIPANVDSPKIKYSVRIVSGTETPREIIHWCNDLVNQVFPGLGLTEADSGPGQQAILKTVTTGNVYLLVTTTSDQLATINRLARATAAHADPTNAAHIAIMAEELNDPDNLTRIVVSMVLNGIIEVMVPRHALQKVKRYLRREYRKPAGMRVRDYFQRLVFINQQELPRLPPFGNDQYFTQSDLIDILLFATPKIWQKEMDRMGFDPLTSTAIELLVFMENCEAMESYEKDDKTVVKKPNNSKTGAKKGNKPSDPKKQKWCDNHGWSNHTTADCNQNKPGFQKGNGNKAKGKVFGNKTNAKSAYQRKTDETPKEAPKELNAVMKKAIQQAVRQEVKSLKKKSNDLHMVEAILSDFNYKEMDNMQIDSDDDRKIHADLQIDSDDEVTV
jgi:hypothetical protein